MVVGASGSDGLRQHKRISVSDRCRPGLTADIASAVAEAAGRSEGRRADGRAVQISSVAVGTFRRVERGLADCPSTV